MTPSKYVEVHAFVRSVDPFIWDWSTLGLRLKKAERTCMSSSQFGQPFLRKSSGCWITEQSRQARSCFDFGSGGIAADMVAFGIVWLPAKGLDMGDEEQLEHGDLDDYSTIISIFSTTCILARV
jgi:hypothetical protein